MPGPASAGRQVPGKMSPRTVHPRRDPSSTGGQMQALSEQEAQAYVEALYRKAGQRWQERVNEGEFMRQFVAGTLPREVFAFFFRNWGAYTIEINTIVACAYQKFLHFFKQHQDLMAAMGEKIADEFVHPKPPGHVLIMMQTAEALGLT